MSKRYALQLATILLLALASSTAKAQYEPPSPSDGCCFGYETTGAGCGDASTCGDSCGSCCHGCRGRDVCCSSVEQVTEKQSCWKVKCEKICVPKVVCPWADGGSGLTLFSCLKKKACNGCCDSCGNGCGCMKPRCGEIRCVHTLDSENYEVTKCKCKWEIRRLPACYGR